MALRQFILSNIHINIRQHQAHFPLVMVFNSVCVCGTFCGGCCREQKGLNTHKPNEKWERRYSQHTFKASKLNNNVVEYNKTTVKWHTIEQMKGNNKQLCYELKEQGSFSRI